MQARRLAPSSPSEAITMLHITSKIILKHDKQTIRYEKKLYRLLWPGITKPYEIILSQNQNCLQTKRLNDAMITQRTVGTISWINDSFAPVKYSRWTVKPPNMFSDIAFSHFVVRHLALSSAKCRINFQINVKIRTFFYFVYCILATYATLSSGSEKSVGASHTLHSDLSHFWAH